MLAEAGQIAEARREFEGLLKVQPDFAPALIGLGALDAEAGRLDEASSWFRRAIEVEPRQLSRWQSPAAKSLPASSTPTPGGVMCWGDWVRISKRPLAPGGKGFGVTVPFTETGRFRSSTKIKDTVALRASGLSVTFFTAPDTRMSKREVRSHRKSEISRPYAPRTAALSRANR